MSKVLRHSTLSPVCTGLKKTKGVTFKTYCILKMYMTEHLKNSADHLIQCIRNNGIIINNNKTNELIKKMNIHV